MEIPFILFETEVEMHVCPCLPRSVCAGTLLTISFVCIIVTHCSPSSEPC